jgi:hypothetical protein
VTPPGIIGANNPGICYPAVTYGAGNSIMGGVTRVASILQRGVFARFDPAVPGNLQGTQPLITNYGVTSVGGTCPTNFTPTANVADALHFNGTPVCYDFSGTCGNVFAPATADGACLVTGPCAQNFSLVLAATTATATSLAAVRSGQPHARAC